MVDTEPMLAIERAGTRTVQRKRSMTYMSWDAFIFHLGLASGCATTCISVPVGSQHSGRFKYKCSWQLAHRLIELEFKLYFSSYLSGITKSAECTH